MADLVHHTLYPWLRDTARCSIIRDGRTSIYFIRRRCELYDTLMLTSN